MIMAADEAERRESLEKLLPFQRKDFEGILQAMEGLTVTIRLLDPPLHEFIPHSDTEIEALARELGPRPGGCIKAKAASLREANPMLGHRGCRLGVTYPEIYEMQVTRDLRGGVRAREEGRGRPAGGHDPARRRARRSCRSSASWSSGWRGR